MRPLPVTERVRLRVVLRFLPAHCPEHLAVKLDEVAEDGAGKSGQAKVFSFVAFPARCDARCAIWRERVGWTRLLG